MFPVGTCADGAARLKGEEEPDDDCVRRRAESADEVSDGIRIWADGVFTGEVFAGVLRSAATLLPLLLADDRAVPPADCGAPLSQEKNKLAAVRPAKKILGTRFSILKTTAFTGKGF